MVCPNCGTNNQDGIRFCATCGFNLENVPVQNPVPPQAQPNYVPAPEAAPQETYQAPNAAPNQPQAAPQKKAKPELPKLSQIPKKVLYIAGGAVALVLVILLLSSLFGGGGGGSGEYSYTSPVFMSMNDDDELVIYNKGKLLTQELEGSSFDRRISGDAEKSAILDSDGTLWYYDGKSLKQVADEVTATLISFDGNSIAYVDEDEVLYLYNGKSTKIAEDVNAGFCISPDGKSVGFATEDDGDTKGYFYDGKVRDLGKNRAPVAISNGAKYIYFTRTDKGDLYVQKGDDSDTKQKLADALNTLYLNLDGTEATVSDDAIYWTQNGGERVKIAKASGTMYYPPNGQNQSSGRARVLGVKSLVNKFYYSDGKILAIDKKGESRSVVSGLDRKEDARLLQDGKTFIFVKNNKLRKIDGSKKNAEPTDLAKDVTSTFGATVDGKTIYYLNEDDELMSLKNGKEELITEDMDNSNVSNAIFEGALYYVEEDELYSTTGGKGKKVSGMSEDVDSVYCNTNYVCVVTDDGEVFISKDGKKFEKIIEQ